MGALVSYQTLELKGMIYQACLYKARSKSAAK